MEESIKLLLHPRLIEECEKLFDDGHFKHVAREAMVQVEKALKEKSGIDRLFGVNFSGFRLENCMAIEP